MINYFLRFGFFFENLPSSRQLVITGLGKCQRLKVEFGCKDVDD
jgi:hypothetical protein